MPGGLADVCIASSCCRATTHTRGVPCVRRLPRAWQGSSGMVWYGRLCVVACLWLTSLLREWTVCGQGAGDLRLGGLWTVRLHSW